MTDNGLTEAQRLVADAYSLDRAADVLERRFQARARGLASWWVDITIKVLRRYAGRMRGMAGLRGTRGARSGS